MNEYDFQSLNDKEFETLTVDILSAEYQKKIERFKPGKDSGVDGRFFSDEKKEIVIQCKHWVTTGLTKFLRYLEKEELKKVEKLNPTRYILVTSLPLSRNNKKKIKAIFEKFILTESDILGKEDLNVLISRFQEVEQRHYKLWLTSTNVLQIIINSGIVNRSNYTLEEIKKESAAYVLTVNHGQAIAKLNENHSLIITGAPGIGKTTLARQICLNYSARGFEFISIEDSLNEAEAVYNEKKKQLFYYDDFLGRNFLLALEHHQDSKIINFIKRVADDSKKRFVLTTRTNIINQGKRLSDLFEINKIERTEYEININSLSLLDRAKILYNHIWFGTLDEKLINEIYDDKRYIKIIEHRNFNPRLISFITDSYRLTSICKDMYWEHIQKTLDNPKEIWKNVIEIQIDLECRHVIIGTVLHGQMIRESTLSLFIQNLKSCPLKYDNSKSTESIIRLLVGALLNRFQRLGSEAEYDLFNPSIADYVISTYLDDVTYLAHLLNCLRTPESLNNLENLFKSDGITNVIFINTIKKLVEFSFPEIEEILENNFSLNLINLIFENSIKIPLVNTTTRKKVNQLLEFNSTIFNHLQLKIVKHGFNNGWIVLNDLEISKSIEYCLENEFYDEEDLILISNILKDFKPKDGLEEMLKEIVFDLLIENITTEVIDEGFYSDTFIDDDIDVTSLEHFVHNRIIDFSLNFSIEDIYKICDYCDFDEIISYNHNASENYDNDEHYFSDQSDIPNDYDAIDDLFDRG